MSDDIQNTDSADSTGGLGGGPEYPLQLESMETRLERRALREQWPMPAIHIKQAVVNRQVKIAIDPTSTHRESTAATRALLEIEKVNVMIAPPVQMHDHDHNHEHNGKIRIIEDEDWFGNADRLTAEALATPSADTNGSVKVQNNGNGQAMGQNGNGYHRDP